MKSLLAFFVAFVLSIGLQVGPASAQTGAVLADFVPGGATGNGRGMAFDGTDLYYTIVGNTNIYKVDTTGVLLATIPIAGRVPAGGPLAWDGTALWTMDYGSNSFTLYRVNPADGSILSSCDIATQNPGHPAVTSTPRNIGEFPDGLDWTGSSLWVSSEVFDGNWVVEVDTSCNILNGFNPPADLGTGAGSLGGTSGVAFDGANLWHPTPTNNIEDFLIFQTDTSGTVTGLSFVADRLTEDLALDTITFAPKCALWGNEATGGPNHLTAYEIPCLPPTITLDPAADVNEAGTIHTVTATVTRGGAPVPGVQITFTVVAGPNAGQMSDPGECSVDPNCMTDVNGGVSWSYSSAAVGSDLIQACFFDPRTQREFCAEATKRWVDTTPPETSCVETTNPHGQTIPPAGSRTLPGSKGGQNEDGFYQLLAEDLIDRDPEIFVLDTGSGTIFPKAPPGFASGTKIKYTEAPGGKPGMKKIGSTSGQAGAVAAHITGTGDAAIVAVDGAGNVSALVFCLVPPPPK